MGRLENFFFPKNKKPSEDEDEKDEDEKDDEPRGLDESSWENQKTPIAENIPERHEKETSNKPISRRNFLRLAAIGGAVLTDEACGATKQLKILEEKFKKSQLEPLVNFYDHIDEYNSEIQDRLKQIKFIGEAKNYQLTTEEIKPSSPAQLDQSPIYLQISLELDGKPVKATGIYPHNDLEVELLNVKGSIPEETQKILSELSPFGDTSAPTIIELVTKKLLTPSNLVENTHYQIFTTEKNEVNHQEICRQLERKINQQFNFFGAGSINISPTKKNEYYTVAFQPIKTGDKINLGEIPANIAADEGKITVLIQEYIKKYNQTAPDGEKIDYAVDGPGETLKKLDQDAQKKYEALTKRADELSTLIQNRFHPTQGDTSCFILTTAETLMDELMDYKNFRKNPHELLDLYLFTNSLLKISEEALKSRGPAFTNEEILSIVHRCLEANKDKFPYETIDKTVTSSENITKERAVRHEHFNQKINEWFEDVKDTKTKKPIKLSITNYEGLPDKNNQFTEKETVTVAIDGRSQPQIKLPPGDSIKKDVFLRYEVHQLLLTGQNRTNISFTPNLQYVIDELKITDPNKYQLFDQLTKNSSIRDAKLSIEKNQIILKGGFRWTSLTLEPETLNVTIDSVDPISNVVIFTVTEKVPGKKATEQTIKVTNCLNYEIH